MQRIKQYSQVSTSLVCLSNEKLKQILADAKPMHKGIGGKSALISIDEIPVDHSVYAIQSHAIHQVMAQL